MSPPLASGTLPLSAPVYAILSALIESASGLHYGLDDRDLFAARVSSRALDAGFESLLDYYYFLRYDPEGPTALAQLVESLLVHETYFYREADSLEAMVELVLAPAVQAGRRPRVWCAACATGEEPLTLAMMLEERGLLHEVEIVASDLSARALERARRGEFNGRAFRAISSEREKRYFIRTGERALVSPALAKRIEWRQVNLMEDTEVRALGTFDLVACRNVLIYFSDETAKRVVERLAARLVGNGHLLVGTSESLLRFGTQLRCEERRGIFFYVREHA